jgi:dolichol-phosphate mannosyltransferase
LSRGGNLYSSLVLGVHVKDMTSGFRAYRSSLVQRMDLPSVHAEGYGFQIEMTYRAAQAGGRIAEVPIQFVDRTSGESKMSTAIVVEALRLVTVWGLERTFKRSRIALSRAVGRDTPSVPDRADSSRSS